MYLSSETLFLPLKKIEIELNIGGFFAPVYFLYSFSLENAHTLTLSKPTMPQGVAEKEDNHLQRTIP